MSLRQRESRPGLPTTHYFVSISRGDSIRTAMLTPAALWALVLIVPVSLGFGVAGSLELAFDDPPAAFALRPADDAPGDAPNEAGRRLLARSDALEERMRDVIRRQMSLERRAAVVIALADDALPARGPVAPGRAPADALRAIQALAHRSPDAPRPAEPQDIGPARAYAPSPPAASPASRPPPDGVSQSKAGIAPGVATQAESPDLDDQTRLAFVDRSLDRIESGEMKALTAVGRAAADAADRDAAILGAAGLDAGKLAARRPAKPVGGHNIAFEPGPGASAFDRVAARVAGDVALAERLRALMPYVPLGKPLAGDTSVASPFGYRIDPFLGRPALHPGVDLLDGYGTEIRAAGAGRVVHAGTMGGYGLTVEIDHGDGLTTRYAHLSEMLVAEGDEIQKGAAVGRLGSTGRSTGPHLHYEVRIDGEPVDPERFLRAGKRLSEAERSP
jgi:murein DD-endopeptidase MepM/ murein hydrolase activator NlpD